MRSADPPEVAQLERTRQPGGRVLSDPRETPVTRTWEGIFGEVYA